MPRQPGQTSKSQAYIEGYNIQSEQFPVAILLIEPNQGLVLEANPQAEALFGLERSRLLRSTLPTLLEAPDPQRSRENIPIKVTIDLPEAMLAAAQGERQTFGWCIPLAADKALSVQVRLSKLGPAEVPLLCCAIVDLDASLLPTEARLLEGQRFIERITLSSPHIMYVFDLEKTCNIYVNRHIARDLGYEPAQIQAMGDRFLLDLLHPDDLVRLPGLLSRWQQAQDGEVLTCEYRMRHADGSWRWFEARDVVFLRDASGRATQIVGAAQDITQRKLAEVALQERELLLHRVTAEAPATVFRARQVEHRFSFEYISEGCMDLLGLTQEELLADTTKLLARIDPRDLAYVEASMLRSLAGQEYIECEFRIQHEDGARRWIRTATQPYKDQHGCFFSSGVMTDITRRKKAEENLLRSHEYLARAEAAAAIMRTHIALDGTLQEIPEQLCQLLHYSRQELHACKFESIVYPEDRTEIQEGCNRLISGQSATMEIEFRCLSRNGSVLWMYSNWSVVRDEEKNALHFLTYLRDITRQKASEQGLERSWQLLQYFVEHTPAAVAMLDKNLKYLTVSRRWLQDFNLLQHQIVGRSHFEVFPEVGKTEIWNDRFERALEGEILRKDEDLLLGSHDRTEWLRWEIRPWYDQSGAIGGVTMFAEVITERKQLEQQLAQAQKLESIGRLAGGVAHDFNNLLTGIFGHLELAMTEVAPDSKLLKRLEIIRSAAQKGADLTKQLLGFARKQLVEPKIVGIYELIRETGEIGRRLIGERIGVEIYCPPDLGNIRIDPGQFSQVLMNLIVNAKDAMPNGGTLTFEARRIHLDESFCKRHPQIAPGEYILLNVADSGTGIAPEHLKHIFEPFFTTKEVGEGTGLGLATCYGIMRQNHGLITVDSQLGVGTVFHLYLPYVDLPRSAESSQGHVAIKPGDETILVVEDDAMVRQLACDVLRFQGYKVLSATNGLEALELAAREDGPIDLLVSDVVMPHMNGPELAKRLLEERPEMKVLLVSGYAAEDVLRSGITKEGTPLLQKPFRPAKFSARVRSILDQADDGHPATKAKA